MRLYKIVCLSIFCMLTLFDKDFSSFAVFQSFCSLKDLFIFYTAKGYKRHLNLFLLVLYTRVSFSQLYFFPFRAFITALSLFAYSIFRFSFSHFPPFSLESSALIYLCFFLFYIFVSFSLSSFYFSPRSLRRCHNFRLNYSSLITPCISRR